MASHNFSEEINKLLNEQVNREYTASYTYTAMAAHFGQDNIALMGLKKLFQENASEEHEHGNKFIEYILLRGGRVQLFPIQSSEIKELPPVGALQTALNLEKGINSHLLDLHKKASEHGDTHLCVFLEDNFLDEQVTAIRKLSDLLVDCMRAGDGLGLYLFDKKLC